MFITNKNGIVTLRPNNTEEAELLSAFFKGMPSDKVLEYGGRSNDPDKPGFTRPRVKYSDREIIITGTSEDDAHEAFQIRDICYYGSTKAVRFTSIETDKQGLVVTLFVAVPCKLCGKPCTTTMRAEWRTCPECVETCEHEFERGAIHGGDAGELGIGLFCGKCGIGKPKDANDPSQSQIGQHRALINEHFVSDVIYR